MSTPHKLNENGEMEVFEKGLLDDLLDQECLKDRQIFLFGDIDTFLSKRIIQQLLFLKKLKKELVTININSPGGSVSDAMAIVDTIEACKEEFDVSTVAIGEACSMAAIILALGTKDKRFATKNATIMFHPCSYDLPEDYHSKQESYSQYTKIQWGNINKLVSKYLGKKEKEWVTKIEDGLWLTPSEALKLKVIDEIL